MKRKYAYLLIFISVLFYLSCQKINLQKDGYFILRADGTRKSYDKCAFVVSHDTSNSALITKNCVYAGITEENLNKDYEIMLYFEGDKKGTYTTIDNIMLPSLFATVKYKGKIYEGWGTPPFPYDKSNIELIIDKYDISKGIIDGSFSGKFRNYRETDDVIELKKCRFRAMDYNDL